MEARSSDRRGHVEGDAVGPLKKKSRSGASGWQAFNRKRKEAAEIRHFMKEKLQSTKPKTRLSQKQKPEMPGRFVQTNVKRIDRSPPRMRDNTAQTDCEVYTWYWEWKCPNEAPSQIDSNNDNDPNSGDISGISDIPAYEENGGESEADVAEDILVEADL